VKSLLNSQQQNKILASSKIEFFYFDVLLLLNLDVHAYFTTLYFIPHVPFMLRSTQQECSTVAVLHSAFFSTVCCKSAGSTAGTALLQRCCSTVWHMGCARPAIIRYKQTALCVQSHEVSLGVLFAPFSLARRASVRRKT
jgi:hypothetical protein